LSAAAVTPIRRGSRPGRSGPIDLLKISSGALNSGCAVLPDMRDSYEPPADHRPWQASPPDGAAPGPHQDHPAHFPGGSDPHGPGPADWAAPGPYPGHHGGHAADQGSLEHRSAGWVGYDPFQRHPAVPPQLHPAHTAPGWRPAWASYDPYTGYPIWPGHPGYMARNAGLRRLSKLTWRAAEVSAVVAVGFVALFARTAHSATKNVSAQHSAKPSVHAAATHSPHKQHKRRHHRHHHAAPPGLAPPAAAPAPAPPPPPPPPAPAPAAPAPAPPPPPVTTSGGSGGG
jgi:hypothetical protein